MTALLSATDLSRSFGGVHAVRDMGIEVQEGSITGLIEKILGVKSLQANSIGTREGYDHHDRY